MYVRKHRKLEMSCTFSADRAEIFKILKNVRTHQRIARPWLRIVPEDFGELSWSEGERYAFRLYFLGFIPLGRHTVQVVTFDLRDGIFTVESNEHLMLWNHEIVLKDLENGGCSYTDRVDLGSGIRTPLLYLWARRYLARRQKELGRILARGQRQ